MAAIALCIAAGCAPQTPTDAKRASVLLIGDSVLAWNRASGRSVAQELERRTGREVVDRSVIGARILSAPTPVGLLHGPVEAQFVAGDWDWIVLNGGGNDLWWGCGCTRCDEKIGELVSSDGRSGAIPDLMARLRSTGARVIFVGYLPLNGRSGPVDHCDEIGRQFEARLARAGSRDTGLFVVTNRQVVPRGDLSFHAPDRIHPSAKGSAAIAANVARIVHGQGG